MVSDDDAGAPVALKAAHRSEPGLESTVVRLDPVVRVLGRVVHRRRDDLADRLGQRRRLVEGTDLSKRSAADLKRIQRSLNDRPRKTLGYMTPSEAYTQTVAATA